MSAASKKKAPTNRVGVFLQNEVLVRRIRIGLAIAFGASFVLAVYGLLVTNILPGTYLGGAILASGLVTCAVLYALLRATLRPAVTVGVAIVALLGIGVNMYIFSAGLSTANFLQSVEERAYSYEDYSIVALKTSDVSLSTPQLSMSFLAADPNTDEVKKEVDSRTSPVYVPYDNPTSLLMGLSDGAVQTAVLKSSYVQLLKENNLELYNTIHVLDTFTIKIARSVNATTADLSKPFVIYISGIDSYGDIATVARSDVNMLAVVNPRTHKILLVNTPRDYYVQLHGTTGTRDKLTHAGIYGVDMSVSTMEDLYSTDIAYNVRINFSSLVKLVDTLGGVEVNSAYAFSSGKFAFNEGKNNLNGEQALAFSRNRYSFEAGDRTRGQNQQRVIEAIIAKVSNPATLVNYQGIIRSLEGTFQTNLSSADISTLFRNQLDSMSGWQTTSIDVTGAGATAATYSMGNTPLYVMEPNQESLNVAKRKIQQYLSE